MRHIHKPYAAWLVRHKPLGSRQFGQVDLAWWARIIIPRPGLVRYGGGSLAAAILIKKHWFLGNFAADCGCWTSSSRVVICWRRYYRQLD